MKSILKGHTPLAGYLEAQSGERERERERKRLLEREREMGENHESHEDQEHLIRLPQQQITTEQQGQVKKKKGKENWQFLCHPPNKEAALEIIMKPHKHVVKHTTKLIRGMSATYQCTVHISCQHAFKLVEKCLPDSIQWTLSELNTHSAVPAPKPRGIDPAIRAKVDEFAILGASPMHILESLSALADFKNAELPTRDQISNRIHGRESKKRKLQMEAAIGSFSRSNHPNTSPLFFNQPLPILEPIPSLRPEYDFQNSDAIEQAYLDMFGPQILYHSVYYQEYGLGMVVSSPTDVCVPPLNLTYQTPALSTIEPASDLPAKGYSHPTAVPSIPTSLGLSSQIPNSVPLAGSSIPISIHSIYPPQWTLFFLNTPPDDNGMYLQCPLGCPGCVNGRIHLLVNRTLLLAGLMGAVDLANGGNGNGNSAQNHMMSSGTMDGQSSSGSHAPVFVTQT